MPQDVSGSRRKPDFRLSTGGGGWSSGAARRLFSICGRFEFHVDHHAFTAAELGKAVVGARSWLAAPAKRHLADRRGNTVLAPPELASSAVLGRR